MPSWPRLRWMLVIFATRLAGDLGSWLLAAIAFGIAVIFARLGTALLIGLVVHVALCVTTVFLWHPSHWEIIFTGERGIALARSLLRRHGEPRKAMAAFLELLHEDDREMAGWLKLESGDDLRSPTCDTFVHAVQMLTVKAALEDGRGLSPEVLEKLYRVDGPRWLSSLESAAA